MCCRGDENVQGLVGLFRVTGLHSCGRGGHHQQHPCSHRLKVVRRSHIVTAIEELSVQGDVHLPDAKEDGSLDGVGRRGDTFP